MRIVLRHLWSQMQHKFWDERYSDAALVYGEAPNAFLASLASRLPPTGTALDLGAGEGRNALFLASLGLKVLAVDQSTVGMQKAQRLAADRGLRLTTQVADLRDFDAPDSSFDVISSIFVHLPAAIRQRVHSRLASWLKPGGVFILEAYAPEQLQRTTGGPKDPALLAPMTDLLHELAALRIEHHAALVRPVVEGQFHTGDAAVIQIVAAKA